MKRDMDLVRSILLEVEKNPAPDDVMQQLAVPGYETVMVHHHVELLANAGFLTAMERGVLYEWWPIALTWEGHEFLDSIRDPEIWQKTRKGASAAGSWTLGILKDLATAYARINIQEVTGVTF